MPYNSEPKATIVASEQGFEETKAYPLIKSSMTR